MKSFEMAAFTPLENIQIVQGGMGVNISTWKLARAVAMLGGLGTVSGVAAWLVMTRILQQGDPGGQFRRALDHLPYPELAQEVLREYYVPDGISPLAPFKPVPAVTLNPSRLTSAIVICANFALVWLAKEGHDHPISINYLEKMQMPHLLSIYGAMLAGVDVVTMGAGIPLQIPGVLDAYARGEAAEYRVNVAGRPEGTITIRFDPAAFFNQPAPRLKRPAFLPIVSADALAKLMITRASGSVEGFVIEGPTAGGHNAPPRRGHAMSDTGDPVYGLRDVPDFGVIRDLKKPFFIGGSCASPEDLLLAQSRGAQGIQVGTIFALSQESGLAPHLRRKIIRLWHRGELRIKTDFRASPTGFPFKVAQLLETLADEAVYTARRRICNHQGLVEPYQLPSGEIVYRCAAEPEKFYLRKDGLLEHTIGRRCLCNGLLAAAGLGDPGEPAIVTLGDDLSFLEFLADAYAVADAMSYLLKAA
jgi:NAD(P)H-dependent flavin oxidoreductase YrpB (nitropropane dioxygenase family)